LRIADRGVRKKSKKLQGRHVALGICGGIGAVETVKVIRELRRHGADVKVFVTPSALDFIGELSLEWAAGSKIITAVSAEVDHLEDFSCVLVLPATWNTIAKAACGISDNPVTLLIAGQLGAQRPLLFVPAMNEQLFHHPLYPVHRKTLESWGARFLQSEQEEGRRKVPVPERVAQAVIDCL